MREKSVIDGKTWPRQAAEGRPGMSASAAAVECMTAPFGTRTGSEGALVSNAQVRHDGKRQFLVHLEARNATGGCSVAAWAHRADSAAQMQAWGATSSFRLCLVASHTPSPRQGRYS